MNVRVERDGAVWTVVIERPQARNAVDPETAAALATAFDAFENDPAACVAVLCGAGEHFCAGADLKAVAGRLSDWVVDAPARGPLGPTRRQLSKPVIAAVEGYAVAGGLELALWCDLRVVARSAVFGVFCRRWGVPLIDGGTVRLPRLIGQSRALDMILTGRPVGADEALAWGLANRVVDDGTARAAAEALARQIAALPQICLRGDRESALTQWGLPLTEALALEAACGRRALESNEAAEGAARFRAGEGRHGRDR